MKIFSQLVKFMGRSRGRHSENNPETPKSKRKAKTTSTNKRRRKPTQVGLKPCLKQPDTVPKKRKWTVKFLERVTVYEVEEIVPRQQKKTDSFNPQNADKVSKASAATTSPVLTEYKTKLNIYYERLAR